MNNARYRSVVASTLPMLTCLVLGLLAGGMVVIGISFVSYWKSLPPARRRRALMLPILSPLLA